MVQATRGHRGAVAMLSLLLVAACGPRPPEPARAAAVAASAPDAPAEQAADAVLAYFTDAELQAETDAQRQELRRALTDLIEQPAAALRSARYAATDGTAGQRDLAQLLRGHFVPAAPRALDLETLIAAKPSPRLQAMVRRRLDALGAAAPAASAASR